MMILSGFRPVSKSGVWRLKKQISDSRNTDLKDVIFA